MAATSPLTRPEGLDAVAASYVDAGYVVVPGLVEADTVEALRDEVVRFQSGTYPVANGAELDGSSGVLAVHFPHWVSDVSLAAVTHPGIAAVLGAITGAHLPHWDGRVKCMQTMLFSKPPGFPGQAWHQDERFIPTRDRSLVAAWIALDDADDANGCLRVLPGSHRTGQIWPFRPHGRPDEYDPTDEAYGFDESAEVLVEVRTGDVVFFNGYLLHRSLRNRSDRSRRAFVMHCMNAWSNLPWMVGMDRRVDAATHDFRCVVPVVGDDPYPDRGIATPPGSVFLRPWHDRMTWGEEGA
jgi:ectoine hydroxylase-related dioxygenase (phytanoyl-CoA dioxygenase family)